MQHFIHVGCGPKHKNQTTKGLNTSGWVEKRLGIDAPANPDVIRTMTDMLALSAGSIKAIFSSHNIEHPYPHEVPVALSEFFRVLSDDGFAVITCPDLQSVYALVVDDKLADPAYVSAAGSIVPIDILYGHRPAMAHANLYMAHCSDFTKKVLGATLQTSGFQSVVVMARPSAYDLWSLASKSRMAEADLRVLASQHFPI